MFFRAWETYGLCARPVKAHTVSLDIGMPDPGLKGTDTTPPGSVDFFQRGKPSRFFERKKPMRPLTTHVGYRRLWHADGFEPRAVSKIYTMGSFYLTCSISHMTLDRQKTSVQILIPKMKYDGCTDMEEHKNLICTNDGAQAFFAPFGFPIHGEYYDYGYIDEIKRDRNVEQIEEFFGANIDDIIKHIGRTRDWTPPKNAELYGELYMTFFRTEVLEFLERGWDTVNLTDPYDYSGDAYLKKFIDLATKAPTMEQKSEVLEKRSRGEELTEDDHDIMFHSEYEVFGSSNCYIKSTMDRNFLKLLGVDFEVQLNDVLKQSTFLTRFGWGLDRILLPSVYGSQETNFEETYLLNDLVNDLLINDMENEYDDYDEEDGGNSQKARIIKAHNRNKAIRELGI